MEGFRRLFKEVRCAVIGMIHVGALPGTPRYQGSVQKLIDNACKDAEVYKKASVEGVLIENMHDIPYIQPKDVGPETTALMTRVCYEIRRILPSVIPCGVQVLAGCNKEAIAVAQASGLQFIRAEGFVFSHVADEGFTDAAAGVLLRYRKMIDAEDILIFTDIKKKHSSHAITADISLEATARAAEFFLSDGVIVTGASTGDPTNPEEVRALTKHTAIPVLVGSGVNIKNIENYLGCNAVIIGTHFKTDARWQNMVNEDITKKFMEKINKCRVKQT